MDKINFTPLWLDQAKLARAKAEKLKASGATKKEVDKAEKEAAMAEAAADQQPRFEIKLASIIERDQFDAEIEGVYRAGEVHPFQLKDIAAEGLNALLGDDAAELIEYLNTEFGGDTLAPTEASSLREAMEVLANHWPAYRTARAQEARRIVLVPTLAFMRWCDGWANVVDSAGEPIEYRREQGVIPDDILRRLEPYLLKAVGREAYRVQYGQGQAGN